MSKDLMHDSKIRHSTLLLASTAFCAMSIAAPVWAEDAKAEGEIVVTARRTEERLQDVPVAVTAFGGAQLAERRINSETDLQSATPGLTVRQTASSNDINFAIRGQSIDSFSFSAPAVTAYFNEVQQGGISQSAFYDLESIQVLKGPQGTLFGRNATGGAVLYSSVKPSDEFGGYLKGGYGNYDNIEAEGAVTVPVTEGLSVRVAARRQKRDGYQHNLFTGDDLAAVNSKSARLSVFAAPPGTKIDNTLVYQYGKYGGSNAAGKIDNANGILGAPTTYFDPVSGTTKPLGSNFANFYGPGAPFAGVLAAQGFTDLADFITKQQAVGFYDVYSDRSNDHDAESHFVSNTTNFQATDNFSLKNIFGYNNVKSYDPTDIDGTPYQFLTIGGGATKRDQGYTREIEQISNEVQANGTALDGKLTYIVGGFISKEDVRFRIPLCVLCDTGLVVPGAAGFLGAYDFTQTDKSKAVFAQGTYAITDRLNFTLGGRYTWENVKITQASDSLLFTVDGQRKDKKPSWLASIDYKLTDDLMVYFSQRGSFRTGGFNGTSAASFPDADTFKPETTYDFEGGAKFAGLLGSMPTRVNIAVYQQIVKDAQRSPYIGISAVAGNVEKAQIKGVEIDGSINLTPWLEIGGSYAYTDAEFKNNRADVGGNIFAFGPYGDTPKNTGSAYFRLSHDLENDGGELALRGDVYAQSSFYYSNLADTLFPNTQIDGYEIFNARVEWNKIMGSKVSAAAYVQNIGEEEYNVGGFALGAVTGTNAVLPGTPRFYGLELKLDF